MSTVHNPRGSIWHRWDPHLHAPGTLLNDQFGGDWEAYLSRIEKSDPKIEALGVTDYFCIETYKEVRRRQAQGRLPDVQLLFPNVELRLDTKTTEERAINIHLLFSPANPNHEAEIERILGQLKFSYGERDYACIRADLIALGRAHDPKQSDERGALKTGANQFKTSLRDLKARFKAERWMRDNCVVAIAGKTGDGTSGLKDDDAFAAMRLELERFADIMFTSRKKDREYWLGEKPGAGRDFIEERYRVLKPCLHGSDAHREDETGEPEQDRFCWLKGDLTFETLRQVVVEPGDRVAIDVAPPSYPIPAEIVARADLTPGDFDSPPFFNEDNGIAFSPDGKQLAFVSNREGGDAEAWTTNHDVWLVPVAGGAAKKLTAANKAADMQPVWAPDGQKIVMRSQRRPGFESDRWYLDVVDVASGQRQTIFETPDFSVENVKFTPGGRSLLFTAQDRGVVNIYSVGYPSGTPKLVTKGGGVAGLEAGRDFAVVAKNTMTSPTDLFRVSLTGEHVQQLTRENQSWLQDVAFTPPETLTVAGAAGAQVQYWLLKPPNFDATKKYPVVFLIHGGPQGAWEDAWSSRWNPALWAAQGWVIAAPNPRGSTGFGQKFVDEISQDWGGKVMGDINGVIDAVAKQPYVDPQRMGIAGASYGGYAVNWIIGHTNRFKAAVTHDGVYNLESMMGATEELWFPEWELGGVAWSATARENIAKWSPHRFAPQIKTPTLVITNELDYRVPVDQGIRLFTALRRQNVPSEMLIFPDEGHWVLKALNSSTGTSRCSGG
jgi:dipeptidyl aminopeptidase/acylaminoacyl peptidase